MQPVTFVANCGQIAADSDMVKVLHGSGRATLFASSNNFSVRCTA